MLHHQFLIRLQFVHRTVELSELLLTLAHKLTDLGKICVAQPAYILETVFVHAARILRRTIICDGGFQVLEQGAKLKLLRVNSVNRLQRQPPELVVGL